MVITQLIKDQVFESLIMFAAGIGLGALYQIWHLLRNFLFHMKHSPEQETDEKEKKKQKYTEKVREAAKALFEIAFWILASYFVMGYLYYAAFGEISFHNFFALLLGVLLWRKFFYDMII